jgi:hypothetical protein
MKELEKAIKVAQSVILQAASNPGIDISEEEEADILTGLKSSGIDYEVLKIFARTLVKYR